MFTEIGKRLQSWKQSLDKSTTADPKTLEKALREVRVLLLEADVSLGVVKELMSRISARISAEGRILGVSLGEQALKVVRDEIVRLLQTDSRQKLFSEGGQGVMESILVVGMQGSGKTTTIGKLGYKLVRGGSKVYALSLDYSRPAAREQLERLGDDGGFVVHRRSIATDRESVERVLREAYKEALSCGSDVFIVDTAGRQHIDKDLMTEIQSIERHLIEESKSASGKSQTLLVADGMLGQGSVRMVREYMGHISLDGLIMTRLDGDSRGGALLSMKYESGVDIYYIGTGERLGDLEEFVGERIGKRIVGEGDIIGLVDKIQESLDEKNAEEITEQLEKGRFNLQDMWQQLEQLKKLGGVGNILGMLPGALGKKFSFGDRSIDGSMIKRQQAIISSMTLQEKRHPDMIKASRKRRIASGSGTKVSEVNKLLKQHVMMEKMIRQVHNRGLSSDLSGQDIEQVARDIMTRTKR